MTKKAAAANRIAVLAKAIDDLAASRFDIVTMHCGALLARDADDPEASLLSGLAAGASGHMQRAARLLHRAPREAVATRHIRSTISRSSFSVPAGRPR
ncbi:MAG: hypothetical protein ABSA58_18325 [Acetobacteraceae bacterium]